MLEGIVANKAPAVMPFFRPWIRKQGINPAETGIGQDRKKLPYVIIENADVCKTAVFNQAQYGCNAVDEWLATDKSDIRVSLGLSGKMFAAAEPDFEPKILNRAGKQGLHVHGLIIGRQLQPKARQEIVDQGLAAGTQFVPPPPAVEPRFVLNISVAGQLAPKADFKSSTRSVRSQEKPPSSSGERPKWP